MTRNQVNLRKFFWPSLAFENTKLKLLLLLTEFVGVVMSIIPIIAIDKIIQICSIIVIIG
jgi:hypothetical protein